MFKRNLNLPGAVWIETPSLTQTGLLNGFSATQFGAHGLPTRFVFDEMVRVEKSQIDGIHFWRDQRPAVLITPVSGECFISVIDFRKSHNTHLKQLELLASGLHPKHLLLPAGCGFGICGLSQNAMVQVRYSRYFKPKARQFIAHRDQTLSIQWPARYPRVTPRSEDATTVEALLQNS